ncbi:HipA domain-containing protein [Myroides sp. LJL110]
MDRFIATFTDVSDWNILHHFSTKGTRSKEIIVDPEIQEQYFFKGSKETPEGEIRYKEEFWSEIVSSKVGQWLGFTMLDYNIAYNEKSKQKIGCISKSMVDLNLNELKEGVNYLTGFDANYNPDSKDDQKKYTFEFICQALKHHQLDEYIRNIVSVIVFDSIVGNSDRHQENWGIITISAEAQKIVNDTFEQKNQIEVITLLFNWLKNKKETELKALVEPSHQFAPIYDSGCCLGREADDDRVNKLIKDKQMLASYVRKGKSEIHWQGHKINHFDLITQIKILYPEEVNLYGGFVKQRYDQSELKQLIYNIDQHLPEEYIMYKLGDHRKELMLKLITLRLEELFKVI